MGVIARATVVLASLLPGTGWGAFLSVVSCNLTALIALDVHSRARLRYNVVKPQ